MNQAANDLVAWLGAQLDEDERVALAIEPDERRWEWEPDAETVRSAGGSYVACGPWSGPVYEQFAAHMVRWDPTRVLAEVEAKRTILSLYSAHEERVSVALATRLNPSHPDQRRSAVWDVLRVLTLPYRDRPGYRPEWAPEATT